MADITNGVNIVDGGSVIFSGQDFTVFGNFDTNIFKTDLFGLGASSDGKEDGIEGIFNFVLSLFVGDYLSSFRIQLDAERDGLLDKLHAGFFHVVSDFVGELLVEASQENRSDHYCDVASKSVQESAALQCYITGTNNQGFPWVFAFPENII